MKKLVLLLVLLSGNTWAGWYGEVGVGQEFGSPVFKPEMVSGNSRCNTVMCEPDNGWLGHVVVGYEFNRIERIKSKIFIEGEHKSLLTNSDEGGFTGVTFGLRWD